MKLGIASTKDGKNLKEAIIKVLEKENIEIIDFSENTDVAFDMSNKISESIIDGSIERGIVIDEYGILPFMVCSKHQGIICAQVSDEHSAEMTRGHNNTKIITMGYQLLGEELSQSIALKFAKSKYDGGRHQVRVDMLNKM